MMKMLKIKNNILFLITIVTMFFTTPAAEAYYDLSWEMQNSDAVYSAITSKTGISTNETAQATTREQLDMIAQADGLSADGYRIVVTKEGAFNAFAVNGQNIFVSLGIFNHFTKSERTAIIAHEWVHSSRHHMLDSANQTESTNNLAEVLVSVFAKGKNIQQAQRIALGTKIMQTQYLQRGLGLSHENSADESGNNILFTLSSQGKANAGGMLAAFIRLQQNQGSGDQGVIGFFSSVISPDPHASMDTRIEKAKERLKAYSGNRVEIRGTEILLDGKLYKVAKATVISGRATSAEVNAALEAGKLAEKARLLQV